MAREGIWPVTRPTEHNPFDPRMGDDTNTLRAYRRDMTKRQEKLHNQGDHVNMEIAKLDEASK